MATLNVTEYANMGEDQRGRLIPIGLEPSLRSHNVTYTTSTASDAFKKETRFVRLISTANAFIEFGTAPTGVATSTKLAADTPEYFAVSRVKELKVAAYDGTS